ncbi:MAG: GGDEF domain-containing protein [Moraxellaceae bacterium]|nr:MAG: GGDEF domain-containing protein [Moraxellaceae bacterium]
MKRKMLLIWVDDHRKTVRMVSLPLIILLLIGITILFNHTGGVKLGYSHAMYIPVLLAGFVFGWRGGVLVGLVAGFMLGQAMPHELLGGEAHNSGNWLFRMSVFALIGFLSGLASDSARTYQQRLKWLLEHNTLSNLPNRRALVKSLSDYNTIDDEAHTFLLVVVCCENEIELKSAFGNDVIQKTILQLAERFAGLCGDVKVFHTDLAQISLLFRINAMEIDPLLVRLLEESREPVVYNCLQIHIDTRIGYFVFNHADELPEDCVNMAEAALIVAKQTSRDMVAYNPAIKTETEENISLLGQLKHALKKGELALHYQPKVNLDSGKIYGVEALIRWNHPERGMIPPIKFIPRAEQSTLIDLITEFVLEQAIEQLSKWQKAGINVSISVNISTRNLLQPGFTDFVIRLLAQHGVSGSLLELEITEGSLMVDVEHTIDELKRLTQLDITISIDDFGTGYSSLQYLHQLPISVLKIDQSFVRRLPHDQGAVYIMEAAVILAHNLGLKAIAEGVENQQIYQFLSTLGCDMAQGYLISRPLPAANFEQWYTQYEGVYHTAALP